MKNSGPSNFRNAGASPPNIQTFTSGRSVTSSEANRPSYGFTRNRVAGTATSLIITVSLPAGVRSIFTRRRTRG
jgi:hypothetical protein